MTDEAPHKTQSGAPTTDGFSATHTHLMFKSTVEFAQTKSPPRSFQTRYKQVIALLYKRGVYSYLGKVRRDIQPQEIATKLGIINRAMLERRLDVYEFGRMCGIIMYNSHSSCHRRDVEKPIYFSWDIIKWINATAKKYK